MALKPSVIRGIATVAVTLLMATSLFFYLRRKIAKANSRANRGWNGSFTDDEAYPLQLLRRGKDIILEITNPPEDTINPWELEYNPNPVIFPNLSIDSTNSLRYRSLKVVNKDAEKIPFFKSPAAPNHSPTAFKAATKTGGECPTTPPKQAVMSTQHNDKHGDWNKVESTQNHDLIGFSRTWPIPGYGVEFQSREPLGYAAESSWESSEKEKNASTPTQHNLPTLPEIPVQSFAAEIQNLSYACPACQSKFRTAGLQRDHYNRKHNRRYICTLCDTAFNLRADLQRHEGTVHKDELSCKPSRTFTCPNVGCTTPRKKYTRKDNFTRHVERCKRASQRAGAQMDGMEIVI